jgi:hypothetical protein
LPPRKGALTGAPKVCVQRHSRIKPTTFIVNLFKLTTFMPNLLGWLSELVFHPRRAP